MDKICPYCQSQHLIKNGSAYGVPTRRAAPAKWKCKDCLRQTSFKPPRGEPLWKKETAVLLYTLGLSMNAIAKQLGVSTPVDPELDPSSCGKARAAPSTGAGRERGRDGIGRTLAFPSKTLAARLSACGHRNGWRYDRRGRGATGNFLVE